MIISMAPLQVAVLALCLVVGIVASDEKELSDVDLELLEWDCKLRFQLAKDFQLRGLTSNSKDDGQSEGDSNGKNRKKRQAAFPYNFYTGYTGFNRFVGSPFLRNPVFNPVGLQSLPILGDASLTRFGDLGIFRFFNRFYPAGIARSAGGVLVRSYARFNAGYVDAQADFRELPLINVQEIATTTTAVDSPGFQAGIFGIDGGLIRLLPNGCSLDGYPNVELPCIIISFPSSAVFPNVVRRFTYIGGFGDGLGANRFVFNRFGGK